jgi:hypothetical protein
LDGSPISKPEQDGQCGRPVNPPEKWSSPMPRFVFLRECFAGLKSSGADQQIQSVIQRFTNAGGSFTIEIFARSKAHVNSAIRPQYHRAEDRLLVFGGK